MKRVPKHIGIIPDGNRRWAEGSGLKNDWASREIPRIDLVVRWGGMCRLSGFLPIQTVYSDFYIVKELWPDFHEKQFTDALQWYQEQDITLGG